MEKPPRHDNHGTAALVEFIKLALSQRKTGYSERYDFLVSALIHSGKEKKTSNDAQYVRSVRRWLVALTRLVSQLEPRKEFQTLMDALFALPVRLSSDYCKLLKAYLSFAEHLVSAHASYAPRVLEKLLAIHRSEHVSNTAAVESESLANEVKSTNECKTKQDVDFELILIKTVENVLMIVPSSLSVFISLLNDAFPLKHDSLQQHRAFLPMAVGLVARLPDLITPVVTLICSRILALDVDITLDMEELEDEVHELQQSTETHNLAAQDEDKPLEQDDDTVSTTSSYGSILSDLEEEETLGALSARIRDSFQKLDLLLTVVLNYGDTVMQQPDEPARNAFFFNILSFFDRSVIQTHKTKYSQLLVFYFSSKSDQFVEALLNLLLGRVFDNTLSVYQRCTASAYISSFMARARFLPLSIVSRVLRMMTEHIHALLNLLERRVQGPDPHRYPVFYAMVQTILYVFCFRWLEMTERFTETQDSPEPMVDPLKWWKIRGGFQRILYSKLKPLSICSSAIVQEFTSLSQKLELAYVVFEEVKSFKEKRVNEEADEASSLAETCTTVSTVSARRVKQADARLEDVMETFFPFDPFFRHLSVKQKFESLYLEWKSEDDVNPAAAG